ncbi:hypothetical protein [Marilutibacter chinensis]|uniref:DUF4124 domain-containing protein n=1 Tax=Marilutibacter chinensis TaxID=2912247 RepID=A0ABS9HV91_9GAMM|nr:hypothetical protein [Lysobacter chinensis]MCF7222804.1 hypothetical protein [Lysobacter chinensis]
MNTIRRRIRDARALPAIAAGALLLAAAPVAAQSKGGAGGNKKLYCWEESGRKVCGDALPASAVDSARTEISVNSGMTTATVGRALTQEERAAAAEQERAHQLAEARLAAQARREKAMAESYATENDLRRAYQNRIVLLDETVKASELGIQGLRQSLVTLLRRASETELAGKPVDKALAGNIQGQHQELLRQQDMLTQQEQERRDVEGEFEAALARYRELKGAAEG